MIVRMAKILTIGLILCILFGGGYDFFTYYSENGKWSFLLFLAALLFAACINFVALHSKTSPKSDRDFSNIWPFIIFKRLALQEQKRIKELE